MSKIWENFEVECTKYLNSKFGNVSTFEHLGGSDSTLPDIFAIHKNFFIEAKHCPAQCGQFVLLPNLQTRTFEYSILNSTPLNKYSQQIIDYMNLFFDDFKESGTTGKEIVFSNSSFVFSNWIINYYKSKGVKFIITNNFQLINIDDFGDAFTIHCKYRIKRSGSSSVGHNNIIFVKNYLLSHYNIDAVNICDDKMFITSKSFLHNERFFIGTYEYMISKREDNYEIRRLSNTFNANVIFSIELKSTNYFLSDQSFISFLNMI